MSTNVNSGPGIRPTLRRASKLLRAAGGSWRFLLVLFGTPVLIISLYSVRVEQSYVVEARTFGATVTVLGPDSAWKLPPAQLCKKLPQRDLGRAAVYSGEGCNPGLFESVALSGSELRIPARVRILMRSTPGGGVLFRRIEDAGAASVQTVRLTESHNWDVGSVLILGPESWRQISLLEFSGNIVIGQEAGTGADSYLIEGRYEVRERFWWQYKPWDREHEGEATAVVSGTLNQGDLVSFFDQQSEDAESSRGVLLTGFVTPVPETGSAGFSVVVSNGLDPSNAYLVIKSFGARAIRVKPSWIERARRDPLLLALTAIIGFAVTSLTFALEVRKLSENAKTRSTKS